MDYSVDQEDNGLYRILFFLIFFPKDWNDQERRPPYLPVAAIEFWL